MTRRYDLVLFDFDGTLADSAPWFRTVIDEIVRTHGLRALAPEELESLRGLPTRAILRALAAPAWKLPAIAAHLRRLALRDAALIKPFEGVDALIAALSAAGVTSAIVSSNQEAAVRAVLGHETAQRIARFACGASLFGKPAKFRAIMKAAQAAPARTLAVGDEARDIEAARQAGCACGAVAWGYATPALLRAQGPDHFFAAMDEIRACVLG